MLIYCEESRKVPKVSDGTDKVGSVSRMAGYYLLSGGVCGKLPALKLGGDTGICTRSEKDKNQTYLA